MIKNKLSGLYLISDESSRISGQVVGVDGNTLRMH